MILTVTLNAAIDKTHVVPGFRLERLNRPAEVIALAGGKGINVARTLTALGEPVLATGVVAGHAGTFIEACLKREGIPHDFDRLITGESRLCLAVVHPETGATTELNETGAPVDEPAFQRFKAHFEARLPLARWVALSGSLPPGLTGAHYLDLLDLARQAGLPVSLDTSGEPLRTAMAGGPDWVKPNQDEAESVLGYAITPESLPRAVSDLLAMGPRGVALTLGAAGAVVATRDEAWFYSAPVVKVVNPVGSGDAFLAGLVTGLRRGQALSEAGALGVACGTANAAVAGAAACPAPLIESLRPLVRTASLAEASWACGSPS